MSKRNIITFITMFLVGILIFWYFIRDININVLVSDFFTINWWWIVVALGCMFLYLGLEAVVTKTIVDTQVDNFTFRDAIRVPLVEQLFNGITPFSSGGQPGQLYVMVQTGVDAGKASSTLLMKFVVFQTMIVINFILSLIVGFQYVEEKLHYLAWLVLFGFFIHLFVIIALLLVMYWYTFTKSLVNNIIKPVRWFIKDDKFNSFKAMLDNKIDTFYMESIRIAKQWKLMLKIIIITFFQLAFYYLIPYFIILALGFDQVNIIMIVSLHVLIFMIISLFPIPGGTGGAEYSFEALFKSFITNNTKLILALIIWRLITYYLGMILGVIAFCIRPKKIEK
ncbi:lysylphosphatidylglycerol synthase transmembrane domain-containing protein [Apilactobacillus apinorum]|uniref:lysylphosphatidylglycerol synthase transmembrane domain-containing protein n=1 Tax=Apilactobacillus apinorum TaxID=1218495 RepID=UPI0006B5CFEE|nr:lysylphosphatidylglycerol synthase transmembrane domain-containing protein [Apilactobacillus apinorum]KOY68552.1 putative integral membrane protein [Apilactobacillus apinorum]CAI2682504.1 Predicted integral membrane protein [Apilactobacillus apinorum]